MPLSIGKYPSATKIARCKWYNDLGYPRINPKKLERGDPDPTGCLRYAFKCWYAHPDHPDWETADLATPPRASDYPDGRRPNTPEPSWASSSSHVKPEPRSPQLPYLGRSPLRNRSRSSDRGLRNGDSRRSPSPYAYDQSRRNSMNIDYAGDRERREREKTWDRRFSGEFESRSRDYSRERDRHGDDSLRVGPDTRTSSYPGRDKPASPRRPLSLYDRVFDHDNGRSSRPANPGALREAAQNEPDRTAPRPSVKPLFLPINSPSNTSLASNAGVPPNSAPSTARSSMPPPPTPSTATIAHQYSVPLKPEFLDAQGAIQKETLSHEERLELWDKRIQLLCEVIAAKRVYNEQVADLKHVQALAVPERTAKFQPALREKVEASLRVKEELVQSARARVDAAHRKVVEFDFWPVRKQTETNGAPSREEVAEITFIEDEHATIKDRVNELGNTIGKIDRQMKEVTQFVSSRARSGVTSALPTSRSIEWESTDVTRSRKRRKTGEDGAYASDSGSTTVGYGSPAPSADTTQQTRRLEHRVAKLESSFHELDNLYTQAEQQAQDEIGSIVELYVGRLRKELVQGVKGPHAERVNKLESDLEQMGVDIMELGTEVAGLVSVEARIAEVGKSFSEEKERIEKERAEHRAAIEEGIAKATSLQDQMRKLVEETNALRRAVTLTTQKPPVPLPHVPTIDHLAELLLPKLLDVLREDLAPKFVEHKSDVAKLVKESVPNFDNLRERVERVLQLPTVISYLQTSGVLGANGNEDAGGPEMQLNGHPPPTV